MRNSVDHPAIPGFVPAYPGHLWWVVLLIFSGFIHSSQILANHDILHRVVDLLKSTKAVDVYVGYVNFFDFFVEKW